MTYGHDVLADLCGEQTTFIRLLSARVDDLEKQNEEQRKKIQEQARIIEGLKMRLAATQLALLVERTKER